MREIPLRLPVDDGSSLLGAIKNRRSSRVFDNRPLSLEQISALLWCCYGVSDGEGRRTAPTAKGQNELSVYLFSHEGVWLYDPEGHRLLPLLDGDHRATTGNRPFVAESSINLVYVADLERAAEGPHERQIAWSSIAVGAMSQNCALWAATHKLHSVVRGTFDSEPIAELLKLEPHCPIILTQSIGHPAVNSPE